MTAEQVTDRPAEGLRRNAVGLPDVIFTSASVSASTALGGVGLLLADPSGDTRFLGIAAIITAAFTGLATLAAAIAGVVKALRREPTSGPTAAEIAEALELLRQKKGAL